MLALDETVRAHIEGLPPAPPSFVPVQPCFPLLHDSVSKAIAPPPGVGSAEWPVSEDVRSAWDLVVAALLCTQRNTSCIRGIGWTGRMRAANSWTTSRPFHSKSSQLSVHGGRSALVRHQLAFDKVEEISLVDLMK